MRRVLSSSIVLFMLPSPVALAGEPGATYADGYDALQEDRLDDAEQAFARCVTADPGQVDCWWGLGLVSWKRNDWDTAVRQWEQVERLAPRHPHVGRWLAKARERLTQPPVVAPVVAQETAVAGPATVTVPGIASGPVGTATPGITAPMAPPSTAQASTAPVQLLPPTSQAMPVAPLPQPAAPAAPATQPVAPQAITLSPVPQAIAAPAVPPQTVAPQAVAPQTVAPQPVTPQPLAPQPATPPAPQAVPQAPAPGETPTAAPGPVLGPPAPAGTTIGAAPTAGAQSVAATGAASTAPHATSSAMAPAGTVLVIAGGSARVVDTSLAPAPDVADPVPVMTQVAVQVADLSAPAAPTQVVVAPVPAPLPAEATAVAEAPIAGPGPAHLAEVGPVLTVAEPARAAPPADVTPPPFDWRGNWRFAECWTTKAGFGACIDHTLRVYERDGMLLADYAADGYQTMTRFLCKAVAQGDKLALVHLRDNEGNVFAGTPGQLVVTLERDGEGFAASLPNEGRLVARRE